ncbi:MAG: phage tail tape measure protein, partial [Hyphomicrobium sp.]
ASGRLGSTLANTGRQGAQAAAGISKSASASNAAASAADRATAAFKRMTTAAQAATKAARSGLEVAFPKSLATPENYHKAMDVRRAEMARAQSGVLVGGLTVGAIGYPLKRAADYELALTRLGNTAGYNGGNNANNQIGSAADTFDRRVARLDKQFRSDAKETRQYATDILHGVDNLIARGMDEKEAIGGSKLIGKAATATATEIEDLSNMYSALRQNLGISEDKMPKAFDIATQAGKLGGFELKNMAKWFPELTVGYSAMGIKGDQAGQKALANISAMLQVAREGAATPDKAANNIANILQKLSIKETRKNVSKVMGIDFAEEMQNAVKAGEDPIMHFIGLISDFMAKNNDNTFLLGDILADRQALDGARALYVKRAKVAEIARKALEAEDVINRDFDRVSRTFSMRAKGLAIAADNLANTLMKGPAGEGKGILGGLEDAFNGLDAMAQRHPRVTGWLMNAGIGLIGFSLAARALSWIKNGVALGALGLLNMFWKFNAAGKNISVLARAARGLMMVGGLGGALLGGGAGMIGAKLAGLYRATGVLGVLRVGLMALARFTLVGTAIWGAFEIVNNWETIAASLTGIWARLQATWAQVKFDYNNPEQRAERYQRFEQEREDALKTGDQRSVWQRMQSSDWWADGFYRLAHGPDAQRPLPGIDGIGYGGEWETTGKRKGYNRKGYAPATGSAVGMQARGVAASPMPATAAANAVPAIMGAATAPITIQAQGPQVTFNQAPPVITMNAPITINMSAADPGAVGAAVSAHLNSVARGALHDGVSE